MATWAFPTKTHGPYPLLLKIKGHDFGTFGGPDGRSQKVQVRKYDSTGPPPLGFDTPVFGHLDPLRLFSAVVHRFLCLVAVGPGEGGCLESVRRASFILDEK